jgi:hypothetical protein
MKGDEFGIILHITGKWNYVPSSSQGIMRLRMTLKTNGLNEVPQNADEA